LSVFRQNGRQKEKEKRDSPLWHHSTHIHEAEEKYIVRRQTLFFIFETVITPWRIETCTCLIREREGDECINALHSTTTSSYPQKKRIEKTFCVLKEREMGKKE
jgi:hypothetical protein